MQKELRISAACPKLFPTLAGMTQLRPHVGTPVLLLSERKEVSDITLV